MTSSTRTAIALPAALLCTLLAACQSHQVPDEVVQNLRGLQNEVKLGRASVSYATDSLKALQDANDPDVKSAFAAYQQAVVKLEEKAGGVGFVADMTQTNTEEYFANWQKELDQISDADLRSAAAERKANALAEYQDIKSKIATLRQSFRPFMARLQNISKVLALDTTPAGRNAALPTIREALNQSTIVLQNNDALIDAIAKLQSQ